MSFEDRATESVRQYLMNDAVLHEHFTGIAENLCKMARNQRWQASEHWSPYQSVVFKLEDLLKDWLEKKEPEHYSLEKELFSLARAYVNYRSLAHRLVDYAVETISYVNDPSGDYFATSVTDYLGPWSFQEWQEQREVT